MKKYALCFFFMLLIAVPAARAEDVFAIDAVHTYEKMARPYVQGYSPIIEGNTTHIVLPLVSEIWEDDIEAELIPLYPDASPIKLSNVFSETVKKREFAFSGEKVSAYRVYFKIALHPARQNGEYPMRILVRGGGHSQAFPITLRVEDGYPNDTAPDIAITGFDAGEALYAGNGSALRMNIENRSKNQTARNILVTMADASGDILPESSDTVAVGTLAAGESAEIALSVRAIAKSSIQPHAVTFSVSWDYGEGKSAEMTEKRTVEVHQEVRLSHTEAQLPVRVTQGDNVAFNLTLMNMGKGALYNALLTFDVPHMAAGGSVLAGNMEPGGSVSANANLRVDGDYTGDIEGTLTLSWEDGYGNGYEKVLPVSSTVIEKVISPAASQSKAGITPDSGGKIAPREVVAWCVAGVFLVLFLMKMIFANLKIRKLEEGKL